MPRRGGGQARKLKKEARRAYSIEREERQLEGKEPTVPDGAVWRERVPPGPDIPAPELVAEAIRRGWDVSEEGKRKCVEDLVAAIQDPDTREALRVRCFHALLLADKTEREQRGEQRG